MGRRRARALLLASALAVAGRAGADVARLDAFVAPLRVGEFARLEDRLDRLAREKPRDEDGAPLLPQVIERLTAALASDETLTPLLARWAQAAPRSRFEPLVRARLEVRFAWRERRGDYAHEVPEHAWPAWYAHLDRADAVLAEAAQRAPDLAQAHAERVWVALLRGRPPEEIRAHFDTALRIDPTNELAHANLLTALTPRWGGSETALLAFARHAAQQHPEDARLGLLVHHAHREIWTKLPEADARRYYREPAVWDEVSRALQRLIDAYPTSGWAHNSLALVAGQAGQKDVALHEFRWIAGRWDPTVWSDGYSDFQRVRAWALSSAGPAMARSAARAGAQRR
jgi:tetratricopeptide (TPR) repeat protein